MRLSELLWDEHAEEHIDRHGIRPAEVDDAVFEPLARFFRVRGDRYAVLGRTGDGRYLFAVLQPVGRGVARVVTARPMTNREKRRYARK
jgi:uncharacterized DUF497 family protein